MGNLQGNNNSRVVDVSKPWTTSRDKKCFDDGGFDYMEFDRNYWGPIIDEKMNNIK